MEPLVSVIVPVYNVEDLLRKCIESIIAQSYKNMEIVLVDDGSTDKSPDICDEYAAKDIRIKVIHKQNGGQSSARNSGLDMISGEYVVFVDSDDYVSHDMVEKFVVASLSKNAEVVVASYMTVGDNKQTICSPSINNDYLSTGKEVSKAIIKDEYPKNFAWAKMYKSSLFDGVRFPEGRIYEDTAIIYKVVAQSNVVYCMSDVVYFYYIGRPNNTTSELMTSKAIKSYHDGMLNCVERLDYIKCHPVFSDMKPIVETHMNRWALLAMQVSALCNVKNVCDIRNMMKQMMNSANVKPYSFALRLAFISPLCYYYYEIIMRLIRKYKK